MFAKICFPMYSAENMNTDYNFAQYSNLDLPSKVYFSFNDILNELSAL